MDKRKHCSSCRKGSDILHNIPTEAEIEKIQAPAKELASYEIGLFRPIDKQLLAQVKDILRDDFIINIINYFDTPKKVVEARMTIQRYEKTTYPEYKITGLVNVDKFDNAPVVFDLRKKFGYVFKYIDFSYIKDGKQMAVSKVARYVISRIVCKKFKTKLRRIQIDYLTKNAKMLNNNEPFYYKATFKEVLETSIGDIIDNVTQIVDPKNSTKGLKKFIKEPQWKYFEAMSPFAFEKKRAKNGCTGDLEYYAYIKVTECDCPVSDVCRKCQGD